MSLTPLDLERADASSREPMERARDTFGMVPNLLGVLARAPAAAHAYLDLSGRFAATSLSAEEEQVVLLTASFENECEYCMAAHSKIAEGAGVPAAIIEALREGKELPDDRLQALRALVRSLVVDRGRPKREVLKSFHEAGYGEEHLLEAIVGVAMKTLSNYVNHVAETPLDEAFESAKWTPR